MRDLEPQHRFALSAALGWLELGNPREALLELDGLPPVLGTRPETLKVRWSVHSAMQHWSEALAIAADVIKLEPDDPEGWIRQSYCLHELKRTQDAWDCLVPAAKKFPLVGTIAYNLGCYACQLGRTALAMEWLGKAARLLGKKELLKMAANDPDLEPVRDRIPGL